MRSPSPLWYLMYIILNVSLQAVSYQILALNHCFCNQDIFSNLQIQACFLSKTASKQTYSTEAGWQKQIFKCQQKNSPSLPFMPLGKWESWEKREPRSWCFTCRTWWNICWVLICLLAFLHLHSQSNSRKLFPWGDKIYVDKKKLLNLESHCFEQLLTIQVNTWEHIWNSYYTEARIYTKY